MLHYFIVLNTMKSHLLECVVMQNYKVEVQNHSEVTEAQDLFLKMGFRKELCSYSGYPKLVITGRDSIGGYSSGAEIGYLDADKITLQELRDMVVLKRNDVNDANYEAIGTNFYKGANWYEWDASIGKWIEYVGSYTNLLDSVKPIKKEEVKMKEYLVKNAETGDYFLTRNHSNFVGAIEIPEGANKYIQSIKYPERFGFLRNGSFWDNKWIKHCDKRDDYIVLWQRESLNDKVASAEEYRQSFAKQNGIPIFLERQKFTQPEELPFVDDEPKLRNIKIRVNGDFDKALEAIQNMGYWNCQFNRIPRNCYWLVGNADATVDYGSEQHMYIDHHVEYFVDGAIDKTQETLNERKSTYGDFENVAEMTQGLLFVMGQYGYESMPDMHKEALHMICSKMARIVNGDHNHLDSWHDIGGYAKLIENNIK